MQDITEHTEDAALAFQVHGPDGRIFNLDMDSRTTLRDVQLELGDLTCNPDPIRASDFRIYHGDVVLWDMSVPVMTLMEEGQALVLTLVRRPQEVADVIEGIYQRHPCMLWGLSKTT